MLDAAGAVCLLNLRERPDAPANWITPGGGLEPDEDARDDFWGALRRELSEELGVHLPDAAAQTSPWIWERTHAFTWLGRAYRQYERFYLLRWTTRPAITIGYASDEERATTSGCQWWTAAQIRAAQGPDTLFAPRALATLLDQLVLSAPQPPRDVSDVSDVSDPSDTTA
jgi:8-oxo-dGTP pyrophosphatase MutT (NUDIX family)